MKRARCDSGNVSVPSEDTAESKKVDRTCYMASGNDEESNVETLNRYKNVLASVLDDMKNRSSIPASISASITASFNKVSQQLEKIIQDGIYTTSFADIPVEIKTKVLGYCNPLKTMLVCHKWRNIILAEAKHMKPIDVEKLEIYYEYDSEEIEIIAMNVVFLKKSSDSREILEEHDFCYEEHPLETIINIIRLVNTRNVSIKDLSYTLMIKLFERLPDWVLSRFDNVNMEYLMNDLNHPVPDVLAKFSNLAVLFLRVADNHSTLEHFLKNVKNIKSLHYINGHIGASDSDLKFILQTLQPSSEGLKYLVLWPSQITASGIIEFIENGKFQSRCELAFGGELSGQLITWRNHVDLSTQHGTSEKK